MPGSWHCHEGAIGAEIRRRSPPGERGLLSPSRTPPRFALTPPPAGRARVALSSVRRLRAPRRGVTPRSRYNAGDFSSGKAVDVSPLHSVPAAEGRVDHCAHVHGSSTPAPRMGNTSLRPGTSALLRTWKAG